ncbi:universal stress protein [Dermabacter sp. p3-SID358]|uniref:universal stress protein n=1 Tax=Dermabacter sp. p3-SID358 TaxID=2916114 RepID=UPI0021A7DB24|nr:universal stress protein [Dermabacter sp. p3-SID358]MCT1866177.1 universal stress protein [Dermabacter sp. p3-SID358]
MLVERCTRPGALHALPAAERNAMVVVAAYAPSSQGDAALKAAIRDVAMTDRDLLVASFPYTDPLDGSRSADAEEVNEAINRISSDMSHDERAYLETLEVRVREAGAESLRDIGDFLLRVAHEEKASLIVIGLRHSAPVGRLMLGQTVKRLLLESPCPVLVTKD